MAKRKAETTPQKADRARRKAYGAACVQASAQTKRGFDSAKDAKEQDELWWSLLKNVPKDVLVRNLQKIANSHLANYSASLAEDAPQPEQVHMQVQQPQPTQVKVKVPPSPPLQPRVVKVSRKSKRLRKRPDLYAPPAAAAVQKDLMVQVFESRIHGKGVRLLEYAKDGTHIMFMEGSFMVAQCKTLEYLNGDSRNDFDSAAYINKRLVQFS
jgi:hypothetical protein